MLHHRLRRRDFLILSTLGAAGGIGLLSHAGCNTKTPTETVTPKIAAPLAQVKVDPPKVRFTDITEKAGIRFQHVTGALGKKLLPETMGSGVAFLDYDNDGRPDILFVNSCYWPKCEAPGEPAPTLALYRNKGDGTFEDVTKKAGLAVTMYGMGVTGGDYDNDGYPDIFVTGVGGNRLFRNVSDGHGGRRVQDVTAAAGVGGHGGWPEWPDERFDFLKYDKPLNSSTSAVLNWSTSAAWL